MPDYSTPQELDTRTRLERPIPRDPAHLVIHRRYMVLESSYSPLALDTPDVDYPSAYLVRDWPIRQVDDKLIFGRTYATIPATRDEPLTMAYTYPGLINERLQFTAVVRARMRYEYFLNPDPTNAATGIPIISRQRYTVDGKAWADITLLNDGGGVLELTSPTATEYKGWITAGTEIVAQDSTIDPYMGNIWARITPYVVAQ